MSSDHIPPKIRTALADSMRRLEGLREAPAGAPFAALMLANAMAVEAAVLLSLARELEASVREDLGRFGADVVEQAARSRDPETAAVMVAEAFLSLCPEI